MQKLSGEERQSLVLQHRHERDKRICDRIKAVLLRDEGWTYEQIAHVLLLSKEAIRQHIDDYEELRKLKPANSGRARINLSGAFDVVDHKVVIQEDKMLNAEATISFFRKVEASYPGKRKIHVFCDNAGYYKNKAVREYLQSSKIELHFLPPYSPNLNPIERLWKWMKERVIYNTYYPEFEDFKKAVFGFFATLSTLAADSVLGQDFRSRVRDKFRLVGV